MYLVDVKKALAGGKMMRRTRAHPWDRPDRTMDGFAITERDAPLGGKLDFGIDLTVGGDVSGGLGWEFDPHRGTGADPQKALIKAGVDFKLEAFIKVEAKVWIVRSAAGVSLSMQSADGESPSRISGQVTPNANRKSVRGGQFGVEGSIEFNGLAIYYAYYLDLTAEEKQGEAKRSEQGSPQEKKRPMGASAAEKSSVVKESKQLCLLLAPSVWLKSGGDPLESI